MLTNVFASQGRWWAWEDLNLGPHPYQLNAGNRCADHRSCRSRSTVEAQGIRSNSPLVCVFPHANALQRRWYPPLAANRFAEAATDRRIDASSHQCWAGFDGEEDRRCRLGTSKAPTARRTPGGQPCGCHHRPVVHESHLSDYRTSLVPSLVVLDAVFPCCFLSTLSRFLRAITLSA
jgi:hypothetical protein